MYCMHKKLTKLPSVGLREPFWQVLYKVKLTLFLFREWCAHINGIVHIVDIQTAIKT